MISTPFHTLIVEDDPSWQSILTEIMVDYGLKVDISNNYPVAVEKLRTTPYRLAIVDLSLVAQDHNNQDGLKILESIQQFAPECVSILLTGHASVELAVRVIQGYGAYTCLRKETFRRSEFREIIHQALATPISPVSKTPKDQENTTSSSLFEDTLHSPASLAGKALLVEDDAGWRNLLTDLLIEAGYDVQASSSYGETRGLMKRESFHLAIIDISLANSLNPIQNQDGYQLLQSIQESQIPAIIVSGCADLELIEQAYAEHQIFTCFEKQSFERSSFLETVKRVSSINALPKLTDREAEVLWLVAKGLGNKEIAANLYITSNTVKRHLKSVFAKLEVNSRAAASTYAVRMGLKP